MQVAYKMECDNCGYVYGANGSDIAFRKCPNCQGGRAGIPFWLPSEKQQ
jgi:rubredoxin